MFVHIIEIIVCVLGHGSCLDVDLNTPGTRGGPGGHDRTLAVKRLHISSSYAKILGETNFQPREIPRSGSKAKNGEREKERKTEGW